MIGPLANAILFLASSSHLGLRLKGVRSAGSVGYRPQDL